MSDKESAQRVSIVQIPDPRHKPLTNGWVDVKFCIGKKGQVVDAAAYKASPPGLYNRAALAALASWKFTARRAYGSHYARTCGLTYHIRIVGQASLAHGPTVLDQRPTAIQADDLALSGDSHPARGKVTMRFCVGKDGKVSDARAIQSHPAGIYDRAAVKILQVWSYWPKTVNGKPVRDCNVEESIAFKLGHDQLVWAYPGAP